MLPTQPLFFISVDVETAGPNPGTFALLSLGACTLEDTPSTYYVEFQPDRFGMTDEAQAVHGLSMQALQESGVEPAVAMQRFEAWIKRVTPDGKLPVCVAFNAPFDWMFIADYFHRYLGRNPFGHAALDIKALYMGLYQTSWEKTSYKDVCRTLQINKPLAHNALQDSLDQANLFRKLLDKLHTANLSRS